VKIIGLQGLVAIAAAFFLCHFTGRMLQAGVAGTVWKN
jgi:hypothetical protein